jgi:hypothetical protein
MKQIVTVVQSRDHTAHASAYAGCDVACCRCLALLCEDIDAQSLFYTLGGGLTLRSLECVGRSGPAFG